MNYGPRRTLPKLNGSLIGRAFLISGFRAQVKGKQEVHRVCVYKENDTREAVIQILDSNANNLTTGVQSEAILQESTIHLPDNCLESPRISVNPLNVPFPVGKKTKQNTL